MAATAISLQLRRRRNTSILLFQNPFSLHLFSSSSSNPDPPNNSDDQTPPSQSQTSLFSYPSGLKQPESLKDIYRKMDMARNGSPNNTGSSTEGGKSPLGQIRESLMRLNMVEVNKRNDFSAESELGDGSTEGGESPLDIYYERSREQYFQKEIAETIGQTGARWDALFRELFGYLCEKEVRKGHRPNTTLDKVGWANVQKEIATRTGRNYTIKQLKNQWDSMKTAWQLCIKIQRHLEWMQHLDDDDVSEFWWKQRMLEYPELKNYRREDMLDYEWQYDALFEDIVATGEKARAPNQQSGIRRDSMCNEEFDPTQQEETGKEGSGDSDEDLATPILSPTSYSGKSKVVDQKEKCPGQN